MALGGIHPPDISQFKFKQVIHTSCPKSCMITRGRRSSSSHSLLDALRVGLFSGHPLLVALKAAQIIKVINKASVCFAPHYTGVCLEHVETTASCPGRDLLSPEIGKRIWPEYILGSHFVLWSPLYTPPGAVSHQCKVSLSPEPSFTSC